jgi:hypothetical protein
MELALLTVIAAVLGGGVSGALLTTWNVHRRLRSIEFHLIDTERVLTREVKRRAAGTRWDKEDAETKQLLEQIEASKGTQGRFDNDWMK